MLVDIQADEIKVKKILAFTPLFVFAALSLLLWRGFFLEDPHKLPSALLDKPFPDFSLPRLDGNGQVSRIDLVGRVALVNLWATWCPTCFAEHRTLLEISKKYDIPIYGINYKDDSDKARQWLAKLGNPYVLNITDVEGQLGIDLGVYGAPETFLIDKEGIIRYKRVGDVNADIWHQEMLPLVQLLMDAKP